MLSPNYQRHTCSSKKREINYDLNKTVMFHPKVGSFLSNKQSTLNKSLDTKTLVRSYSRTQQSKSIKRLSQPKNGKPGDNKQVTIKPELKKQAAQAKPQSQSFLNQSIQLRQPASKAIAGKEQFMKTQNMTKFLRVVSP